MRAASVPALLACVVAVSAHAEVTTVPLCETPTPDETEAAAVLGGWLRSARLRVEACPADELPTRRFVFASIGDSVWLRFHAGGAVRERAVPWLSSVDAPLSRLRAQAALAKLSVLIEALLEEAKLDAPPEPPPREAPPSPPRPRVRHSVAAAAPTPPPVEVRKEAEEALLPQVVAPPPEVSPPPTGRAPWSVEASCGARLRTPGIWALEVAGALRWGVFDVGASYDARSVWSLGGAPVALAAAGSSAGASVDAVDTGTWSAGVDANARVEWLSLRRLDVQGAAAARYWDAGLAAGVHAGLRAGAVGGRLTLEAVYMPTARQVLIPAGPSGVVDAWGARATLGLLWSGGL